MRTRATARTLPISGPARACLLVGVAILAPAAALSILDVAPGADVWARVEITGAAAIAFAMALASIRGTVGRIRTVRSWIAVALGAWAASELVRDIELAAGLTATPAPSSIVLAAIVPCAGILFYLIIHGRVDRHDEIAFYLDATIAFLAVTALLLTLFGPGAMANPHSAAVLAFAVFLVATTAVQLLLYVTLRSAVRPRSAWLFLPAVVLMGLGFVVRLAAPSGEAVSEAGLAAHLVTLGLILAGVGTAT